MLSAKMTDRLNAQINLEFYSSNLYLQMAAWCDHKGFAGAAEFLKVHAGEEMMHMQRLFDYVAETGALPVLGAIEAAPTEFKDLQDVFEATLEHERLITSRINELVGAAFEDKDFSTFNFLQWYVSEQHEEEALFQGIVDKIKLIGMDGRGIYFLDKEIQKLATATPQTTADTTPAQ